MTFDDISEWYGSSAVRAAVTEALLSEADGAEFLSEEQYGYIGHVSELYGTEYEDIIPAMVYSKSGYSSDMWGRLYRFKLTPELKAHIRRVGIDGMFACGDGRYCLQNLVLLKGEEVLCSCISHECYPGGLDRGYIADSFKDVVLAAAEKVLKSGG
ncbi:MAG TPA: hypothetical protein IAB25_01160 [Candidatus Coproplasma stercoravium]|nr:hypothetical protein [Candidatus Coproplasma stercoravium]